MGTQVAARTRDILGGLSLAVWLAMTALATFVAAVIPDWPPPDVPHGTAPPLPPDGCLREINAVMSTSRYVCRGTPMDGLTSGALNYARDWLGSILLLPFIVLAPQLRSCSSLSGGPCCLRPCLSAWPSTSCADVLSGGGRRAVGGLR